MRRRLRLLCEGWWESPSVNYPVERYVVGVVYGVLAIVYGGSGGKKNGFGGYQTLLDFSHPMEGYLGCCIE